MDTKPMKQFGAVCCVYDDHVWLRVMIESCYEAVGKLFFLVNARPWNGAASDNEMTLQVIHDFPDPEEKVVVIQKDWVSEAAQRNDGLEICRLRNLSHCVVIDADEVYNPSQLAAMTELAAASNISLWLVSNVTYWKSYRYKIDPPELAAVPLIIKVGEAVFVRSRIARAARIACFARQFGVCHHLSYARSDLEVLKKIQRSTRAAEVDPGWFTGVWNRWDHDKALANLHPIWPKAYRRAVLQNPDEYPPVLKAIYERDRQSGLH